MGRLTRFHKFFAPVAVVLTTARIRNYEAQLEKDHALVDRKDVERVQSELSKSRKILISWQAVADSRKSVVRAAPGHGLLAVAEFLYSAKVMEEVLRPAIDDMRIEYNDALKGERVFKARWVRVRGTWSFLKAAGLLKILGSVKVIVKVWKAIP